MKDKICERCGEVYNPDAYTQKYCQRCGPIMMQERARERWRRWAAREKQRRKEVKENAK